MYIYIYIVYIYIYHYISMLTPAFVHGTTLTGSLRLGCILENKLMQHGSLERTEQLGQRSSGYALLQPGPQTRMD